PAGKGSHPEYTLTPQGEELMEALFVFITWGDHWLAGEAGPPMLLCHKSCKNATTAIVRCSECGERLHASETYLRPGPSARVGLCTGGGGSSPKPRRARSGSWSTSGVTRRSTWRRSQSRRWWSLPDAPGNRRKSTPWSLLD